MRSVLILSALLIVNLSFAQHTEVLVKNISVSGIEQGQFKTNGIQDLNKELFFIQDLKPINNSEGKFAFYKEIDQSFVKEKESIVKTDKKIIQLLTSNSLAVDVNLDLIHKILLQKFIKNEVLSQVVSDDNYNAFYKTYDLKDKLNILIYKGEYTAVELGNNIYQSINKLFKTEIDKTLDSSLNLLTFNF
ncbi:hypothetical protein [uncultured Polaribacter sp.]|uniref:hypothetical protein n=1 Tax=uncultured Polaribacter sp. TaxID=174711 RepID=UPI0026149BA1|nr:hypothetical protein [uncultured Polaribacter sp.]